MLVKPPTDTIDLIRSTLQTGVVSVAVEQAASHYARLSQECSTRLERIAAMLDKGSDYQALQAAEEEPPLLDMIAVLSFGGEKAWLDFCQVHQLPIAPKLDAKTVQALDRLYAQGVTANHPLYKDFRAAVLSREHDKALRIVRTIVKLNPSDENARSELQRLENKHGQELLDDLRLALKTDDEERIARLVEKITREVPAEKLANSAELSQAEGIRRALRRRQAETQIPEILAEAEQLAGEHDWNAVSLACDLLAELLDRHEMTLSGRSKSSYEALNAASQQKRAEAERQRAFDRALAEFKTFAHEAETQLLTGIRLRLSAAASLDEHFVRRWRQLESYGLPVSEEALADLRQVGQKIRAALEHAQRGLRARALMSAAALMIFLGSVCTLAWHGWQARAYALDLSSYKARQLAEPAAKLIATLKAEYPLLLRWPYLRAKVEETQAWTGQGRDLLTQAESTLQALENDLVRLTPVEALKRLADARAQVSVLPGDIAVKAQQRLMTLKTKSELMLATLGQTRAKEARQKLEQIHKAIQSDLSYEKNSTEVREAVARIDQQLAELEAFNHPEAAALQLPADLDAQIQSGRQHVLAFQTELRRLEEVQEATSHAITLQEYRNALHRWQDIRFIEAASAAAALTALPTEEQFLAHLMTGGDLAMWKACLEDLSGATMYPDATQESDLKRLLALRDDPHLNGIWENVVVDHSSGRSKRSVWSLGPLMEARVGDKQQRWSGKVFDAHPEDTGVAFIQTDFKSLSIGGGGRQGQSVISAKPSPTGTMIKNLQLDRMTDANGERFERSLLSTLDRLMEDSTGASLAKAYVMLELERLAVDRPFAWGLHLCPSLRADLAELHKIMGDYPLRSEDWMLPKARLQFGNALDLFFTLRRERAYEKEAQARRVLVMRVSSAGVRLGGFVDTDHSLRLNSAARAAREFWLPVKAGPMLLSANTKIAPQSTPAFIPVFFLPLDRQEILQNYRDEITEDRVTQETPLTTETPFLQ